MHTVFWQMAAYLSSIRFIKGVFFFNLQYMLSYLHAQCPHAVKKLMLKCFPFIRIPVSALVSSFYIDKHVFPLLR